MRFIQELHELETRCKLRFPRQTASLSLPPTPRPRNFTRTISAPNTPPHRTLSMRSLHDSQRLTIPRARLSIAPDTASLKEPSAFDPNTF